VKQDVPQMCRAVRRCAGASPDLRNAGLSWFGPRQHVPIDTVQRRGRQSGALTFNVSHLLVAFAISGAAEIGTSKPAAAGSAEHDAVAPANKLRAAVVDRLAVDRHKAEPTSRAAAKSRGGDLGALDDKQGGDIVIAFDVDRDILA
jgi:hypothetical protein